VVPFDGGEITECAPWQGKYCVTSRDSSIENARDDAMKENPPTPTLDQKSGPLGERRFDLELARQESPFAEG